MFESSFVEIKKSLYNREAVRGRNNMEYDVIIVGAGSSGRPSQLGFRES
ncbi:MAG: hypothetical protein Ct9H300mP27_02970 [Chloroflexota bacterium]|nr:MAG: hypothetical protein Ct9H300mP27_02970 [Chloroflexota bacterium]